MTAEALRRAVVANSPQPPKGRLDDGNLASKGFLRCLGQTCTLLLRQDAFVHLDLLASSVRETGRCCGKSTAAGAEGLEPPTTSFKGWSPADWTMPQGCRRRESNPRQGAYETPASTN